MFDEKILKFYDFLESNPSLLHKIKQENKVINADNVTDFINKKIIPIAKKEGFNIKSSDFHLKNGASLSENDMELVSGGINLKATLVAGMTVFASAILGGMALNNAGVNVLDFLPTSSKISIKDETLRDNLKDDKDYEEMIKKEVESKAKAQNQGTYSKDKGSNGLTKYGFGDYQNQKGTLSVPNDASVKKLNDPILKFIQLKNKKSMVAKSYKHRDASPLFRHEPVMQDIHQGAMGNCYFESTLISVLSSEGGSQKVLESMVDNGDGTVTVRLFDSSKNPRYFKVDKNIPKVESGKNKIKILNTKDHVIWPAIMLKAYTAALSENGFEEYRSDEIKNKQGPYSYEDVEFGNPNDVLKCVFGLFSSEYKIVNENISGSNDYSKEQLKIFSNIERALKNSNPVCAGSRPKEKITKQGINSEHAFSVVDIKSDNNKYYLGIVDPWREKSNFKSEKDRHSGFTWIELGEFCENFFSYNIGK